MRDFSGQCAPVNEEFRNNLAKTMPFFARSQPRFGAKRSKLVAFCGWTRKGFALKFRAIPILAIGQRKPNHDTLERRI